MALHLHIKTEGAHKLSANFLFFSFLEFFATLLKAGRVSHPDVAHTTVEPGSSSPSTSVFQPNGAGTKKASEQLANRRRRTRKYRKN